MGNKIIKDMEFLCNENQGGRLSGSIGARRSAEYLAKELSSIGFEPLGSEGFFEKVSVPAARLFGPVTLEIGKWKLRHRIEFGEISFYGGGSCEGELLIIDEQTEISNDMYDGKIVFLDYKSKEINLPKAVELAKELGIKAIFIDGGEPRWFHKSIMGNYQSGRGIPVIRIRSSLVEELKRLSGEIVKLQLPIETSERDCQNVIGILPGKNRNGKTLALVSHYDFLGDDPMGFRFQGAGDNASGVATILDVARRIADLNGILSVNILVVFTTGEESHLWGEKHLLANPPIQLTKTIYLDAIGRTPYFHLNIMHNQEELAGTLKDISMKQGVPIKERLVKEELFSILLTGQSNVKYNPYHTPDDNLEYIHIDVLEKVSDILFELLMRVNEKKINL